MKDVIIIGAGLFGCIIAKQLMAKGLDVAIIDNAEPMAGSRPAACLMKPSWFSSMGKENYTPAMETLESLYDVKTIEFKTGAGKANVKWIDPESILKSAQHVDSAEKIDTVTNRGDHWTVEYGEEWTLMGAKKIILAAGVWCNELLEASDLPIVSNLSPLTGTSFTAEGKTEAEIKPWMPYKQIVKFNIEPNRIWVGDGVSLKNYGMFQLNRSLQRCANFIDQLSCESMKASTGHRPYIKDIKPQPCYLKEHAPGLWVVTGGAKNGTIAAGWASHQLGNILG